MSNLNRARFASDATRPAFPRRIRASDDAVERIKDGNVFLYPKCSRRPRLTRFPIPSIDVPKKMDSFSENLASNFQSQDSWSTLEVDSSAEVDCPAQNVYRRLCSRTNVVFSRSLHHQLALTTLRLCHHRIQPTDAKIMAASLSISDQLKNIDLRDNQLTPASLGYILKSLRSSFNLQYLTVSENSSLGADGATLASEMLATNNTLTYLNLSDNGFDDTAMASIFQALTVNCTLRTIVLNYNTLHEAAGPALQRMLTKNRTLETLELCWNHIRCKGASSLANGLAKNKQLRYLNLSWNGFGLEGCHEIGKALERNHCLQELDLSSNRVSVDALRNLAKGLVHNTTLLVLKIGGNPITTDGAKEILHLVENTSITQLNLDDVSVDSDFVALLKAIQTRRSLAVTYGVTLRHDDVRHCGAEVVLDTDDPLLVLFEYRRHKNLRLIDLLHAFDKDHSENVTRDEFRDGFKTVDLPLSMRSLDILMKKLDSNRDGAVDYELTDGKFHFLRVVNFYGIGFLDDSHIEMLSSNCIHLEVLALNFCLRIKGASFKTLILKCKKLKTLLLQHTGLEEGHMQKAPWEVSQIHELDITSTELPTDCLMDVLNRMPGFTWLSVAYCEFFNDAVLEKLSENGKLNRLRALNISYTPSLSENTIYQFLRSHGHQLEGLLFGGKPKLTENFWLDNIPHIKNVKICALGAADGWFLCITTRVHIDQIIECFAQHCARLERLEIQWDPDTIRFSDKSNKFIDHIRLRCPHLRSFTLSDGEYYEMVKSNFERADRGRVVRTTTNYTTDIVSMLTRFNDLLFN